MTLRKCFHKYHINVFSVKCVLFDQKSLKSNLVGPHPVLCPLQSKHSKSGENDLKINPTVVRDNTADDVVSLLSLVLGVAHNIFYTVNTTL